MQVRFFPMHSIECQLSIRNGKVDEPSTNFQFLGQSLRIPVNGGMNTYVTSVQRKLTNLDRQINESTSGWKSCVPIAVSKGCRSFLRNATAMGATAARILQNLRKENERLLQTNKGSDSDRARCLSCVRSSLNRIFFGLLPDYWFQFGLNFGGNFVTASYLQFITF